MGRRHKTLFRPCKSYVEDKEKIFGFDIDLPTNGTIRFVADPQELQAVFGKQYFAGEYEDWLERVRNFEKMQAENAVIAVSKKTREIFEAKYAEKLNAAIDKSINAYFNCKKSKKQKETV